MDEIEKLKQRIELLENFMADFVYSDRFISQKHFQFIDGRNMQFGTTNGSKIGTSATQKISVYGVTPVIQAGAISAPSSPSATYVQAEATSAVTAINSIRTAIKNFGITA